MDAAKPAGPAATTITSASIFFIVLTSIYG
jgi:hypothetical protein